ncbi:hypothetical protein Ddye_027357 [Dipteronia dyeriana]|uniref:F-box domain-containing protein n=1 Tax=Dipteronia dyeriana TaxID=168575 RepID=A0AAD9TNZ5_9ROSI|nr:hypothetical protein Ddye_027357 [Dipteronia dyeriana]
MAVTVRNPKILRTSSDNDDDGGDRLTSLPEPIIHYIFSFLETIDVFRASAVSRKWRYFWGSMPYLNFDIHTIWSKPQGRWPLDAIIGRFKDFVNWSLSLYVLLNRYKQVKPIINLLNLTPNLEALTILIDWMDWSECWEIPDEVTCSTYHLKSSVYLILEGLTLESRFDPEDAYGIESVPGALMGLACRFGGNSWCWGWLEMHIDSKTYRFHTFALQGTTSTPIRRSSPYFSFPSLEAICIPFAGKIENMMNFRPISLYNVTYKFVAKTLASRFRTVIGKVISKNQSAFILSLLISDSVIIGFEITEDKEEERGVYGFETGHV